MRAAVRSSLLGLILCLQAGPTPAASSAASLLTPPSHAAQRQSLISAVARMDRGNSAGGDVYFVGFAGFGEQRVFRKEAELAQRVFASRYGTGNRSLLLVNDIHDRRTYPLATFENLRIAVDAIGRRMHTDRDTLVLMLTSHGNDEDGVAITNGRLPEDALSPEDVRKILDESGIRWRIIVVSACYAGIFIPVLKSDATLVMTAADARHSSFGCDDSRDLTYFGEALLRDALPHACSLGQAYADTARIIRARESDEGEIHSNPKLFIGVRMQARLPQLEAAAARGCAAKPATLARH
ncbi:MAG TPA: C13 family peptidase [Steroidobacteraceae bacterium]|nr:C13 family peptidase [Steroidobacteraceae bacterium]